MIVGIFHLLSQSISEMLLNLFCLFICLIGSPCPRQVGQP